MLATKTMLPLFPVFNSSLAVAWATRNVPVTLMSKTWRKVEGENSVAGPFREIPAQQTRPLMGCRRVAVNLAKVLATSFSLVTLSE